MFTMELDAQTAACYLIENGGFHVHRSNVAEFF